MQFYMYPIHTHTQPMQMLFYIIQETQLITVNRWCAYVYVCLFQLCFGLAKTADEGLWVEMYWMINFLDDQSLIIKNYLLCLPKKVCANHLNACVMYLYMHSDASTTTCMITPIKQWYYDYLHGIAYTCVHDIAHSKITVTILASCHVFPYCLFSAKVPL